MAIVFSIAMIVCLFTPLLLWWIRNLSRIFAKSDVNWITDNLGKIFSIFWFIALICGLFLSLSVASII